MRLFVQHAFHSVNNIGVKAPSLTTVCSNVASIRSYGISRQFSQASICHRATSGPGTARHFSSSASTMSSHNADKASSSRLSRPLPTGTIDTHMHIIPPDFEKFPLMSTAQYKPTPHTIDDANHFYKKTSGLDIQTPRMVLTQVSIYGTDNSALLSGLAALGDNGRGVVEFDPSKVTDEQLRSWWDQGVRGVRINFVSVGRSVTEDELHQMLQTYVDRLQGFKADDDRKWVIEMYIQLSSIPLLRSVLARIDRAESVRWCLDHFSGLKFKDDTADFGPDDDPYLIPGFSSLVEIVTSNSRLEVYVKLSAAYRIDGEYPSPNSIRRLGVVGRELVKVAEDRVMWASDWPHTRFESVDSVPFVEACYDWCGTDQEGEKKIEKLFRRNAETLWDIGRKD